jgi:hypothetical protein
MEWELLMNGGKVIAIKRLFSKTIDLFKADMCLENCLSVKGRAVPGRSQRVTIPDAVEIQF